MVIFLDPGHGILTPGKRSPDGKFREYKYCREIAQLVKKELESRGFTVMFTVTNDSDMPLSERCRRINLCCEKYGNSNVISVSIHNNAAGIGTKWMEARGWSIFVGLNASLKSEKLATCLYKQAGKHLLKLRPFSPDLVFWKQSLAMCRDTHCPAVLIENLFQDNKQDVAYLISEVGKKTITDIIVLGIIDYINSLKLS